jgi:hypothetical protein
MVKLRGMTNGTGRFTAVGVMMGLLLAGGGCASHRGPPLAPELRNHHTVAILPFEVLIAANELPVGMTLQSLLAQQQAEGRLIQRQLHSRFREQQLRGRYTVEFQDVDRTTALLEQAGFPQDSLKRYSKEEIARVLGVDGVLSGTIRRSRPMSTGQALALGLLLGGGIWGSTNRVEVDVRIHDGGDGKLLWTHEAKLSGSVGSTADRLAGAVMNNISRSRWFPYRRR